MPYRIRLAHRWTVAWIVLPLLVVGLLLADNLGRSRNQAEPAGQWMRLLDLSAPAFRPSGTIARHPEFRSTAVDTRFSPWLPASPTAWPMAQPGNHEN